MKVIVQERKVVGDLDSDGKDDVVFDLGVDGIWGECQDVLHHLQARLQKSRVLMVLFQFITAGG